MSRFDGRVALVTGAGGGIGRACVARLNAEGATVVAADVDESAAQATGAAVGGSTVARVLDVTDPASCAAAVAAAVDTYGRLDVLVNVAGVGGFAPTGDVSLDDWNRTIAVNLTGTFLMSQAALAPLLDGGGAIVNLASVAGVRGVPYNAAYCASKGGVVMLTKSMAVEFGRHGLRVNCVCPGMVDTGFLSTFEFTDDMDMSLFARGASVIPGAMSPDVVAAAVAYLASRDASSVTGAAMMLDGGATA